MDLKELQAVNDALVSAATGIHVLGHVTWPGAIADEFLASWQSGRPKLPQPVYPDVDLTDRMHALDAIAERAERLEGPVGQYLAETARSYLDAARFVANAGTATAGDISVSLYGRPGEKIPGSERSSIDAARYFINVSREYHSGHAMREPDFCLPAATVAKEMSERIGEVITMDRIRVVLEQDLPSKAAAGATRIRLRDETCFSGYDVEQLLQHEAFVHSLTGLNGRRQPVLTAMSLGAPRTTAAQEGLATFAELVTGAIDISRMARIALRVGAVDAALSGADFIEVFRYLLDAGQTEFESYHSAMRVFRGVPVTGGSAFAKDAVYLTGLLEVHTFFRWALSTGHLHHCERFFAGRMRLSDLFALEDAFEDGTIGESTYQPPWMTRTNGLTAYLAFSVFGDEILVNDVSPDAFTV